MTNQDSEQNYDVTIIGAGIVGVCCALSLMERGKSVQLIDESGVAEKTSYGNAGVISPWSCVPQSLPGIGLSAIKWLIDPLGPISIRVGHLPSFLPWAMRFLNNGRLHKVEANSQAMAELLRDNVNLYRHHLSGTGQVSLIHDSHLVIAYENADEIDLNDISFRLRIDKGAKIEKIDAPTLQQLEPALSRHYQAAVLVKDQGRTVSPAKLTRALADKVLRNGALLRIASVKKLRPQENGSWQLETSEGILTASNVLVAAGAWSPTLLEPLGLKVPLACERGYHLEFAQPRVQLNNSVLDVTHKFITSSMEGGIRSAGTAEFDTLHRAPNYRRADMLKPLTKSMLPDLNTDTASQWMGIRPSFPDSLPCIDAMPGHRNLFMAFGHSHYGLGMAPQTGEFVAKKICEELSEVDMSPYGATRF